MALGLVLAGFAVDAWARPREPGEGCAHHEVVTFPTAGPERTRWEVCWEQVVPHGLVIRFAAFRPSPNAAAIQVLGDARLAEIFVPYHPGSPRFLDFNREPPLMTLNHTECPTIPPGTLVTVCRETRDRGLAWKVFGVGRRGEELLLWAIIGAENYHYVVEWTFRDDGTIVGRAGSTGPKLGGGDNGTGHMHTFTWRLDVDLGGPDRNSVVKTSHVEPLPGFGATDVEELILTEGGLLWTPEHFTTLEVEGPATLLNANGRRTTYELIPLRSGTARHNEAFTGKDFWVTRHDPTQVRGKDLPSYDDGESVVDTDVVVWYTGAVHHETGLRDEERSTVPLKWVGFELSPKNASSDTPLYPLVERSRFRRR